MGKMIDACHHRNIAVAIYFNAGLNHEMAQQHRDWVVLGRDGRVYGEDRMAIFFVSCVLASLGPSISNL